MKKITFVLTILVSISSLFSQDIPKTAVSTLDNQKEVNVTVYNNGLSLIQETRKIHIRKGIHELKFEGIPEQIKPSTVLVKSLTNPKSFSIIEQNYEYDLMNKQKMLDKFVGEKIKLLSKNPYKDNIEIEEATLLSNNNGQIFKIGEEIYLDHKGARILPKIPENLISKPTLMWKYKSSAHKNHDIETTYLTRNLSWEADYVFLLSDNEKSGDLNGWVTINNLSGATYNNAGLKLIAGDVNRISVFKDRGYGASAPQAAYAMESAKSFKEKDFFEYHLYTLPYKTTLKNNQSKQIKLLNGSSIKTDKQLIISPSNEWFSRNKTGDPTKLDVNVFIKFDNTKENNLALPIPKGVVRVYKKDSDGSSIFIGEDRVDHTPINEEIKLKIGKSFDIVAEKTQTEYNKPNNKTHITSWKVKIKNRKKKDISITYMENIPSSGEIIKSSVDFTKINSSTLKCNLSLPADSEKTITYAVKVKYR